MGQGRGAIRKPPERLTQSGGPMFHTSGFQTTEYCQHTFHIPQKMYRRAEGVKQMVYRRGVIKAEDLS